MQDNTNHTHINLIAPVLALGEEELVECVVPTVEGGTRTIRVSVRTETREQKILPLTIVR
jgi:hypothetical protein